MSFRSQITLLLVLLCAACAHAPAKIDPAALAATAPETESAAIARLMRISSVLQRSHFEPGNRVVLLKNGPETYSAMLAAISGAQRRIDMETYQFDTQGAALFAPILMRKAQSGVAVHLVYDAWGSLDEDKRMFDTLRAAGVVVIPFNPVGHSLDLNHRDHRKLLVVDDRIAITGGVNVTGAYLNRRNTSDTDPEKMRWRDTDVLIEGPAVAQFQALFLKTWNGQHGPALPPPPPAPLTRPGQAEVEAIDGAPIDDHPVIYETLLSAVALSKRSVHLTTGFFGPPPTMVSALQAAARRGVDVALVLPAHSDSDASLAAGRSHYEDLLEAGVKIYEREGVVLHAKTAVVDGLWAVVGSSNLDWRSTVINNEIDAVVVDEAFGAQMERMFADDVAASTRITREQWASRSLGERIDEAWARLFEEEL